MSKYLDFIAHQISQNKGSSSGSSNVMGFEEEESGVMSKVKKYALPTVGGLVAIGGGIFAFKHFTKSKDEKEDIIAQQQSAAIVQQQIEDDQIAAIQQQAVVQQQAVAQQQGVEEYLEQIEQQEDDDDLFGLIPQLDSLEEMRSGMGPIDNFPVEQQTQTFTQTESDIPEEIILQQQEDAGSNNELDMLFTEMNEGMLGGQQGDAVVEEEIITSPHSNPFSGATFNADVTFQNEPKFKG
jgi:hypothetical protein